MSQSAQQAVPTTVEGDQFDAQKIVRGPSHKQNLITWQLVSIKKPNVLPAIKLIVEFRWVDNGVLDLGTLTGASFKGGAPAEANVGAPASGICNSVGCLYTQSVLVNLPSSVLRTRMESDGLPIKIVGTRFSEVITISAREIAAVLDASKAL